MLRAINRLLKASPHLQVTTTRGGRFLAPGAFYVPFSERFDEESNRRPPPHPETPKFRGKHKGTCIKARIDLQHWFSSLDELPPPTGAKIADKRPFRMICQPRKIYWWCACGLSKEQPFCDGHHARQIHKWPARNQKNMFKPIKVVFEKYVSPYMRFTHGPWQLFLDYTALFGVLGKPRFGSAPANRLDHLPSVTGPTTASKSNRPSSIDHVLTHPMYTHRQHPTVPSPSGY